MIDDVQGEVEVIREFFGQQNANVYYHCINGDAEIPMLSIKVSEGYVRAKAWLNQGGVAILAARCPSLVGTILDIQPLYPRKKYIEGEGRFYILGG